MSTLVAAAVAATALWEGIPVQPRHDVLLLYVGADDCPPCRTWQRGAGATFRSSPEFTRLTYREIKSPTLLDVMKDDYWPADLRGYRDHLDRSAGVPLWMVISDHDIVERAFGPSQWTSVLLPKLKSLLR
jgi:hypothetical protein